MKGEYIKNGTELVETDEATYQISYSVRFVDGKFRCVARLRYEGQSWRHDPIHKKLRFIEDEYNVEDGLQEVVDSCRDAIESIEVANDLDLSVTVK